MAFNPEDYQVDATEEKCMPVVLLLDVSSSMDGDKIYRLYEAVKTMTENFAANSRKEEIAYKVAIITFGSQVKCHTRYTDAKNLNNLQRFSASGMTPLGAALKMAKGMIEDRDETKSLWYKPAVVLVSDGAPNDDWQEPSRKFIKEGRSSKCQRISVAIGGDADEHMLKGFVSKSEFFFKADDASKIAAAFEKVTMSVMTDAATQKDDVKMDIPKADKPAQSVSTPSVSVSRRVNVIQEDDDRWN